MNREMERLSALAAKLAPDGAVTPEEFGFTLDNSIAPLYFFAVDGVSSPCYCRACVASLGATPCPLSFAEAALKGNFFWRATDGAVLSLDTAKNAIYLTDRFDEGAFANEAALASYADNFLRTLHDWRSRLETALAGKEVQA